MPWKLKLCFVAISRRRRACTSSSARRPTRSETSAASMLAALNLAEIEHARGQTQRAIAIAREVLPALRSGADKSMLASLLANLAGYLVAVDDLSGAVAAARESIGIHAAREPDHAYVAIAIEHLALVFALRGDRARAAMLEGYADAAFARHGFEREFTETTTHDRLTALLREDPRARRTRATDRRRALHLHRRLRSHSRLRITNRNRVAAPAASPAAFALAMALRPRAGRRRSISRMVPRKAFRGRDDRTGPAFCSKRGKRRSCELGKIDDAPRLAQSSEALPN